MPASGDRRVGWWTASRPVGGRCLWFHRFGRASRLRCESRFARARPLSLAPHRFDWRRSWTERSPDGISGKITTDSNGRIKNNWQ
jgi:hypothetical protein